jgi:hypothetical protein
MSYRVPFSAVQIRANLSKASVLGGLAALTLLLAGNAADAAPLLIVNAGFEASVLDDGGVDFNPLGWNSSGDSGAFDPHAAALAAGAPEGENVAFASFGSPTLSQTLASTAEANTMYTLSLLVGNRLDAPFGGYQAELWAGGTLLASDDNSLAPTDGSFLQSTVQYFVSAGDAVIGSALEIRFRSLGWQTVFDDVQLDAEPRRDVPEPGLLTLLALGAGTAAARRRRTVQGRSWRQ